MSKKNNVLPGRKIKLKMFHDLFRLCEKVDGYRDGGFPGLQDYKHIQES